MRKFVEQSELIRYAKTFVKERVEALEKDVQHCLREPYAPFPAIVYCFSTIDLLGSLSAGDASPKANTSQQSVDYMRRFMHYTDEQSQLLMRIFRHKIVHLAQPKVVSEYNGKRVAWRYWHDSLEQHLKLSQLKEPAQICLTSSWTVTANHEFQVSITHFAKDVASSASEPGGYLHALSTENYLQDRFEKAIVQIYESG